MTKLRVGVIGTGIGAQHVADLERIPGVVVAGVCSAQQARAEAVAAKHGVALATDDYRRLLEADIDAVVIATPPALHAPMTLAAVERGIHVLCEKPLAATGSEARTMRDAAHAAGIVHAVNHQARFARTFRRAKVLAAEGYLGNLAVADSQIFFNPVSYLRSPAGSESKSSWYTDHAKSGGMLASAAGPHQIDLLQWYGGPIAAVAAQRIVSRGSIDLANGTTVDNVTADDGFLVLARFAHGGIATIRGIPIPYHSFGVVVDLQGTSGAIRVSFDELCGATASDRALVELQVPEQATSERVALLANFVEAIRGAKTTSIADLPTFDDGVTTQSVLEACLDAALSGKWVTVASG